MSRTTRKTPEATRVERIYAGYRADPRKGQAWDARNAGNVAIRAEVLAHLQQIARLQLAGQGHVLDAGCGSGFWLRALNELGVTAERLHGMDALPERVETLAGSGFDVCVGDVRDLPYEDGKFDLILLFTVLSSLANSRDVQRSLLEARRTLAPGGLLLCWEPRVANPLNRATRLIRKSSFRALGGNVVTHSVTVWPPLARRLGRATPVIYPVLARIPVMRSHRLVTHTHWPPSE